MMRTLLIAAALLFGAPAAAQTIFQPARPVTVIDRGLVPTVSSPAAAASNATAIDDGLADSFSAGYPVYIPVGTYYADAFDTPVALGGRLEGAGGAGGWVAGATLGPATRLVYADTDHHSTAAAYTLATLGTPQFTLTGAGMHLESLHFFGRTPTDFGDATAQGDVGLRVPTATATPDTGGHTFVDCYWRHFNRAVLVGELDTTGNDTVLPLNFLGATRADDCDVWLTIQSDAAGGVTVQNLTLDQTRIGVDMQRGGSATLVGVSVTAEGGSIVNIGDDAQSAVSIRIFDLEAATLGDAPRYPFMLVSHDTITQNQSARIVVRDSTLPTDAGTFAGPAKNGGPCVTLYGDETLILDGVSGLYAGMIEVNGVGNATPVIYVRNCRWAAGETGVPADLVVDTTGASGDGFTMHVDQLEYSTVDADTDRPRAPLTVREFEGAVTLTPHGPASSLAEWEANGKQQELVPATYVITDTITVGKGQRLQGAGRGVIIQADATMQDSGTPGVMVQSADYAAVEANGYVWDFEGSPNGILIADVTLDGNCGLDNFVQDGGHDADPDLLHGAQLSGGQIVLRNIVAADIAGQAFRLDRNNSSLGVNPRTAFDTVENIADNVRCHQVFRGFEGVGADGVIGSLHVDSCREWGLKIGAAWNVKQYHGYGSGTGVQFTGGGSYITNCQVENCGLGIDGDVSGCHIAILRAFDNNNLANLQFDVTVGQQSLTAGSGTLNIIGQGKIMRPFSGRNSFFEFVVAMARFSGQSSTALISSVEATASNPTQGSFVRLSDDDAAATEIVVFDDITPNVTASDTVVFTFDVGVDSPTDRTFIDYFVDAGTDYGRLVVDYNLGAITTQGFAIGSGTAPTSITSTDFGWFHRVQATFTADGTNPSLRIRPAVADADGTAANSSTASHVGSILLRDITAAPQ